MLLDVKELELFMNLLHPGNDYYHGTLAGNFQVEHIISHFGYLMSYKNTSYQDIITPAIFVCLFDPNKALQASPAKNAGDTVGEE